MSALCDTKRYEIKSAPRDGKERPAPSDRLNDFLDPWEDWRPQWRRPGVSKDSARTKRGGDAHEWQERHSPTQAVDIKIGGGKTRHSTQRRVTDARLWDALSDQQQDAALEISLAFEMMGRGLGYATSDWTKIPGGGGNIGDAHARLIGDYVAWTRLCHAEKTSHSMIIDILVYGFSCRALDRDRRVRAGASKNNLLSGLTLYADMKGWLKRR
jgi:hypothetical protein